MSENDRITDLRQETDQVKELLCQNVNKLNQRGENLEELSDRSQMLRDSSRSFSHAVSSLRQNYWWRNVCIWVLLWIIVAVLLGCLIAWLVASTKENNN